MVASPPTDVYIGSSISAGKSNSDYGLTATGIGTGMSNSASGGFVFVCYDPAGYGLTANFGLTIGMDLVCGGGSVFVCCDGAYGFIAVWQPPYQCRPRRQHVRQQWGQCWQL